MTSSPPREFCRTECVVTPVCLTGPALSSPPSPPSWFCRAELQNDVIENSRQRPTPSHKTPFLQLHTYGFSTLQLQLHPPFLPPLSPPESSFSSLPTFPPTFIIGLNKVGDEGQRNPTVFITDRSTDTTETSVVEPPSPCAVSR